MNYFLRVNHVFSKKQTYTVLVSFFLNIKQKNLSIFYFAKLVRKKVQLKKVL